MMEGRLSCGVDSTKLDYVVNPDLAGSAHWRRNADASPNGGAIFPAGRIGKGFAGEGSGVVRS